MHKVKKYTVILLFNKDGSKVLLIKKDRTAFAGKLNGVGGKIEDNEPEQCDMDNAGLYPELWFYSGIVEDESWARTPENETEPVAWYMLGADDSPFTYLKLAGDGDLEYFIKRARRRLFGSGAVSYE